MCATLALAAGLGGCEPVSGGLIEVYWQLASSSRVVDCTTAMIETVQLTLAPIGAMSAGGQDGIRQFPFQCTLPRGETGFNIAPGDYQATLQALAASGEVMGCSPSVFINVSYGQPSSLRVVEIDLGRSCPGTGGTRAP
jgi:hypothetical protein